MSKHEPSCTPFFAFVSLSQGLQIRLIRYGFVRIFVPLKRMTKQKVKLRDDDKHWTILGMDFTEICAVYFSICSNSEVWLAPRLMLLMLSWVVREQSHTHFFLSPVYLFAFSLSSTNVPCFDSFALSIAVVHSTNSKFTCKNESMRLQTK